MENTRAPPSSTHRTGSLGGIAQHGRERPWTLEHRTEQSPLCWAFQRLLQIARSSNLGRNALAQSLEPPCTDPYARWCGRGGAERLPPIPIFGTSQTQAATENESAVECIADRNASALASAEVRILSKTFAMSSLRR